MFTVLKWICFIIVCTDVLAYIINKTRGRTQVKNGIEFIAFLLGVIARVFVLYSAATYWLLV